MEKKEKNIIKVSELLKRDIHLEKIDDFEYSIFCGVYKNARKAVEKIVQDNRKCQQPRLSQKSINENSISNVISFVGRRGTGKTSAMLSFRDALEQYDENNRYTRSENLDFSDKADMKHTRFFSLDYIDASALEESEDIFVLVLANILNYLDKIRDLSENGKENEYRSLLHQFQVLLDDFLTLKESMQYKDGIYSSYEKLLNVSSSQRVRMQFRNLVKDCLEYIKRQTKTDADELYLVIPIDDLDMAHYNVRNMTPLCVNNKSYEIINSIQKYLSVPGVIVLTAYNHVNLLMQNKNFFLDCATANNYTSNDNNQLWENSSRLSNQFIDKAFAPAYRVYLPSWKKRDYMESRFKVDVMPESSETNSIFRKYCDRDRRYMNVKELVLISYAEKTGIYYDCEGKKQHFLEPDSLRRLVDMMMLFDDAEYPLVEEFPKGKEEEARNVVLKKIKDDLYFRYIEESLYLPGEKELFNDLMELRIDRRSQELVRIVSKKTEPLGKAVKERSEEYEHLLEGGLYELPELLEDTETLEGLIIRLNDNSNVEYSFAELVHSLFHMTRDDDMYSKEFVDCILHSFSVYLSEIYHEYRLFKKKIWQIQEDALMERYRNNSEFLSDNLIQNKEKLFEKMEEDYEILNGVIGNTICGRWCEYFFPRVYTDITGWKNGNILYNSVILGYAEKTELIFQTNQIKITKDTMEKIITEFVALSMFYTDVLTWEKLEIDISYPGMQNTARTGVLIIKLAQSHDMELTAFYRHAFCYTDFLTKLETLLLNAATELKQQGRGKKKDIVIQAIKNVFGKLWTEFQDWDRKYGNMILPIQNFDCTYNLIKHVYQETSRQERIVKISSGEDFWTEFLNMNDYFVKHLKRIDNFYLQEKREPEDDEIASEEQGFAEIFLQCPFINLAKKIKEDKLMSKETGQFIMNLIISKVERDIIFPGSPDDKQEGPDW